MLIGLDTLGVEVAKNLVLSGLKKLLIFDKDKITIKNLLGNFFVNEKDLGLQKDVTISQRIQNLNYYT